MRDLDVPPEEQAGTEMNVNNFGIYEYAHVHGVDYPSYHIEMPESEQHISNLSPLTIHCLFGFADPLKSHKMVIAWKLFWEINKPAKAVDGAIDGFCPPGHGES